MIILIADDDRLVRFTIKSILQEILGDSGDIFLEARNGQEMANECREHHPDIAFVDIRMPVMNGLDAIAESKKYSKETEYVIVSGYSDFTYAREGIRLGVNEYLLKPADEEEIRRVMERLQEKVEKNRKDSNSRFQLRVMNAFSYYSSMGAGEDKKREPHGDKAGNDTGKNARTVMAFMLWVKTERRNLELSARVQKRLLEEIGRLGDILVERKGCYAVVGNSFGIPCSIFLAPEGEKEHILSRMRKLSADICGEENERVIHHFLWFEKDDLDEVCKMCESAEHASALLLQEKPGSVNRYEDLPQAEDVRSFLILTERLTEAWGQADGVACKEILNKMWREYQGKEPELNMKNMSACCSCVTGFRIGAGSLKEFCRSFVEHSEEMYAAIPRTDSDVIEQVKEYIQKYYMNDISVSQTAEHFELTANYLSTIFHQRTGERFADYLTKTRLEAAKKLLVQNVSASVQDVALMIGYNSARHFSALFQKQTAMTPSAYRKQKTQKDT